MNIARAPRPLLRAMTGGLIALASASLLMAAGVPARTDSAFPHPYAAIVIDGITGRVLHEDRADELRHPASLTKVMTLYLLFEELEAGRMQLDTRLTVSAHATKMEPTKLFLKKGETITVEDAILGLVTHSANDVAVVIAEALAYDEGQFAEMMTAKARMLGMNRTVYRNASGLPDPAQVTTARDQATLGLALQVRFPDYYGYFSTRSFRWRGKTFKNHNRLLDRVAGMDGIKTGYIRASRFNLLASVHRDERHIVAVVLGGATKSIRDNRMCHLVEECIEQAARREVRVGAAHPRSAVSAP